MRHSLDLIRNKASDYTICQASNDDWPECNAINWYENTACIRCGTEDNLVPATETRIQEVCADIAEGWLDDDDNVLSYDMIIIDV